MRLTTQTPSAHAPSSPAHEAEVTAFVAAQAQAQGAEPFVYSGAWLRLIAEIYGYRPVLLVSRDADGKIAGALPICVLSSPLTGRRVVSLPFTDCCPPLARSPEALDALLDQAIALARAERARYLELRASQPMGQNTGQNTGQSGIVTEAIAARRELAANELYARWVVALTPDTTAVWKGLRAPTQRQVKKARKLGVQARVGSSREDMETYYQLHLRTRTRKHGMPAQPRRYFLGLWDRFGAGIRGALSVAEPESGAGLWEAPPAVRVLLAEHEGRAIAGIVLIVSGTTVRYAYGASHEGYLHLGPNNLLMWEAIAWACQSGYARFDLGRTAYDNVGLMDFKRGWGAKQEPLTYYYWPRRAGLATTQEHSWKYRAATSIWRRLPLPVAETLGSAAYRHLG